QLAKLQAMPRREEVPPAEARLKEAEANLADQTDQYERYAKLETSGSINEFELIRRRQAMAIARAQVDQARTNLDLLLAGAWQHDKSVAEAAVAQAEAQLKMTQTDLERLEVRASVDGVVLQVDVRPGEYVGTPPNKALVVLGGARKNVRVDIDENDL